MVTIIYKYDCESWLIHITNIKLVSLILLKRICWRLYGNFRIFYHITISFRLLSEWEFKRFQTPWKYSYTVIMKNWIWLVIMFFSLRWCRTIHIKNFIANKFDEYSLCSNTFPVVGNVDDFKPLPLTTPGTETSYII